jgi:hypothetical protein
MKVVKQYNITAVFTGYPLITFNPAANLGTAYLSPNKPDMTKL